MFRGLTAARHPGKMPCLDHFDPRAYIRRISSWASNLPSAPEAELLEDHPLAYHFMLACLSSGIDDLRLLLPPLPSKADLHDVRRAAAAFGISLQSLLARKWLDRGRRTVRERAEGTLSAERKERADQRNANNATQKAAALKVRGGLEVSETEAQQALAYERNLDIVKERMPRCSQRVSGFDKTPTSS